MKRNIIKINITLIIALVLIIIHVIYGNSNYKNQIIKLNNNFTKLPILEESIDGYNKYNLPNGLNIIAIDLGGPVNNRATDSYGDAVLLEQNGNYLLMDTGTSKDNDDVLINFLKSQEINHFDIYISHYHHDHYGKTKKILKDSYFTVDNVYFPNPSIFIPKLDDSKEWYSIINPYYELGVQYANDLTILGTNVVLISEGSTINIGDATLNVIWDISNSAVNFDEIYSENTSESTFKNRVINNTSLVSMVNYKGVRYLTAGDIMIDAEQDILEKNLDVKADIFKFSHHGARESNTDDFVNKVNPKYAFLPNNYEAGHGAILWYGDRDNGAYLDLVNALTNKTNVLSTLYNGNILYNISPNGEITTDITRNYNKLTIKYKDIDSEDEISDDTIYYFNDRAEYHLDSLNYNKKIKDYIFKNSTYIPNQVLTEDDIIYCYYEKVKFNINYSTETATNQDVTVYIVSNTLLNELEGWTLSQDRKTLSKTYTQNTNENIVIKDLAGNETSVNVAVTNIDKIAPQAQVSYSTQEITNGNVIVTISANKEIQELEGWTLSQDKKTLSKTYTQNANENIVIKDLAGNEISVNVSIANINNKEQYLKGDVNKNGEIDISDILQLERHIAYINSENTASKHPEWKLNSEKLSIGDINENGIIDIVDILKLLRYMSASNNKETAQKHADWLNL